MNDRVSKFMLDLAARHAARAAGLVEPNPLVGAVITREPPGGARTVAEAEILSIGHHRRFGQVHAERDALDRAQQLGRDVLGCTMYVTLEPCSHTGKQPPCAEALIHSGITRIVCARKDPNPLAASGAEVLRQAGITVEFTTVSTNAIELSEPFIQSLRSKLPWIIAKWASTIDGHLATRTGDSKWITSEKSRRHVQYLRSRVDAIVTGIGTVLADDPELTCRDVPARRCALRVVLDSQLQLAERPTCKLLRTLDRAPLLVLTTRQHAAGAAAQRLMASGVTIAALPHTSISQSSTSSSGVSNARLPLSLRAAFELLRSSFNASTVLVEAGGTLLGSLLQGDSAGPLADEVHIYTGPILLADAAANSISGPEPLVKLSNAPRWRLIDHRRIDDDTRAIYRRGPLFQTLV